MRSQFDTTEYVKGLTVAGMARAQAQSAVDQARTAQAAGRSGDAATIADLEHLKAHIDAAAAGAQAELERFRRLTFAGLLMLCASILLLHFSRH